MLVHASMISMFFTLFLASHLSGQPMKGCGHRFRDDPLLRLHPKVLSFPTIHQNQSEAFRRQLRVHYRIPEDAIQRYDQCALSCVGFATASYLSTRLHLLMQNQTVSAAHLTQHILHLAAASTYYLKRPVGVDLSMALHVIEHRKLVSESSFPSRNDINVQRIYDVMAQQLPHARSASTLDDMIRMIDDSFGMLRPEGKDEWVDLSKLPQQLIVRTASISMITERIKNRRLPTLISYRSESLSIDTRGFMSLVVNDDEMPPEGHAAVVVGLYEDDGGQLIFELSNTHANAPVLFVSAETLEKILMGMVDDVFTF